MSRPDDLPSFGALVRAHREARGITIRDLAYAIDVDQSTIYCWERGERKPTIHTLRRVARALHVSESELRRAPAGPAERETEAVP